MKREELFNIIGEADGRKVAAAGMAMDTKRKSRPAWVKWGAVAACLCLVAVGALAAPAWQGEHETTQPAGTDPLVVNEAESVTAADMDVRLSHYDNFAALEQEPVLQEFQTANGLSYDDFTAKIPDTYALRSFYSVDVPADAAGTEYIPHDYVFEYQTETGGEIRIAICSAEEPLRDHFVTCDDPKQSEINGVPVVIYGYQGSFMVECFYENIHYDIEASNITIEELEDLLAGIMA